MASLREMGPYSVRIMCKEHRAVTAGTLHPGAWTTRTITSLKLIARRTSVVRRWEKSGRWGGGVHVLPR